MNWAGRGYGFTPNNQIPLNDREPGEIAKVAIDQLLPYRVAAASWPIYRHYRDERHCMVCRLCDQNIWFIMDQYGKEFDYAGDEVLSLIVAHIRQIHADKINDKGELIYENRREHESEVLDLPYGSHALRGDSRNPNRPEYQSGDTTGIERTTEANS